MGGEGGVERTVRAAVTTYRHPDGSLRHALRGETVLLHPDGLARWDELDGQDAPPPEIPAPVSIPVERYAPVVVEKRGPGRPRKDGS